MAEIYPLVKENLSNIDDSRMPKKYKAYYEGDQSLILTRSVEAQASIPFPHPLPDQPSYIGDIPRLEFFDINHTIANTYSNEKTHTWFDLYSWPTNGIVIQNPTVKENYVDIPGGNGSLDFSEALTGYPLYENRTGSISFEVDPYRDGKEINNLLQKLNSELHGRKMYALIADDVTNLPDAIGEVKPVVNYQPWYYEGRLSIDDLAIDDMCPTWNLNYNFSPYKKLLWRTGEDSVWDAFDFEDGIFYEDIFKDIVIGSSLTESVGSWIGTMPTVPKIIVSASTTPQKPAEDAPDATGNGMYVRISDNSRRTNNPKDTGWIFLPNGTYNDPRFTMVGIGIYLEHDMSNETMEISDACVTINVVGTGTITFDMEIGVI